MGYTGCSDGPLVTAHRIKAVLRPTYQGSESPREESGDPTTYLVAKLVIALRTVKR